MDIALKDFNPQNASKDDWNTFHIYRKKYHSENEPDEPYIDDKTFEKVVKAETSNEMYHIEVFGIQVDQKLAGLLFIQFFPETSDSYKGNENNMMFKIELDKDYRHKGIGSQVLEKVVQLAELYGRSVLITEAQEEDGKLFLQRIGAKIGLTMRENRLYIKDIDWQMVDSWINEAQEKNPETKLQIFTKIPDEIIENYCKTFTFAGNQAPRDDLEMGDFVINPKIYRKRESDNENAGITTNIACTIEQDGMVSGLTELISIQSVDYMIRQGLTAVLEEERGRKLGKWLKASLLLYIKEKYPNIEYIITGNASSNGPMLAINTQLGFKLHKEKINSQISLSDLKKYLENRHIYQTISFIV